MVGSQTCSDLQNSGLGQSCVCAILTAREELLGSFKKESLALPQGRGWDMPSACAAVWHKGRGSSNPAPPSSLCFLLYKMRSPEKVLSQVDPGLHSCLDQAPSAVIRLPYWASRRRFI